MTDEKTPDPKQQEADARRLAAIEESLNVVSELTVKMRRFTIRYLFHGKVGQAAEEAGYSNPSQAGSRLRKHPKVLAAIDEYFHQQEMSAARVIALLSEQASAAYASYIHSMDGRLWVDTDALIRDGKGHLVKGVKETRYGQVIEFHDAYQARVDIGRYHGLFKPDGPTGSEDDPISIVIRYADPDPDAT